MKRLCLPRGDFLDRVAHREVERDGRPLDFRQVTVISAHMPSSVAPT